MKHAYIYILFILIFTGCVYKGDYNTSSGDERNSLVSPLILKLNETLTKSYDDDLKWSWEDTDTIWGYQHYGNAKVNPLTYFEDGTFGTSEFTYHTYDKSTYHFVYLGDAKINQTIGENRNIDQDTLQSGVWRPIFVGSHTNCTFDEMVAKDGALQLEHLSSAFEVRAWDPEVNMDFPDDEDKIKLSKAILYSEDYHILVHAVPSINYSTGAISYTQKSEEDFYEAGESVTVENIDSHSVVFNVAPHPEDYPSGSIRLILIDEDGNKLTCQLPSVNFKAGKKTVMNITWEDYNNTSLLPKGTEFNEIVCSYLDTYTNINKIKFITESDKTSNVLLTQDTYLIKNSNVLEIHTSKSKFIANEDCYDMFCGKTYNTNNEAVDNRFSQIVSIELGNSFDTSDVTDMFGMFSNCKALTNLNLGNNFSTQNVTNMALMFSHCTSIKTLTLSNFDTSKVTDMEYMFFDCTNLRSLDLTSFSFQNDVEITDMFYDVGKEATNKPISIDMTPAGKAYIESKGDSGIDSSYAKII